MRAGGVEEEEGDDRSRWGGRVNGGKRVNSHVTGTSCSVDGKREIQQPQKFWMIDVVFIKPHCVASIIKLAGQITVVQGFFQQSLM